MLLAIAILPAVPHATGQVQTAPVAAEGAAKKPPAFDVMSIRPNDSGSGSTSVSINNGVYSAVNISLKRLLENTYGIKEDLISGVPGAIDSMRFDVMAKILDPDLEVLHKMSNAEQSKMLLPFLIDRFQLKAHVEIKSLPVYELMVAPGGLKMKPSLQNGGHNSTLNVNNNRELTSQNISMGPLAKALAGQVHRTVIDKTGLTDGYDVTLKWSPDYEAERQADAGPSLFTAVQEQLGLKLQPAKGPVETLVVDHVAMPSEN